MLYTTLDGPVAISSPSEGTGSGSSVTTTPTNDFVPARVAGGLRANAVGEHALFRQVDGNLQNVENDRGTMEFWYRPDYDHDDDLKYTIAGTGTWKPNNTTQGSIHFGKHNSSNNNMIFLILFDANGTRFEHNVLPTQYSWNAGDWLLIRITWDMTVPAGERNMHLYIDGVELPLTGQVSRGPQPTLPEMASEMIYIGSRDDTGQIPARGLYDEFRIWNQAIPPS
jgi:hypothetical protein